MASRAIAVLLVLMPMDAVSQEQLVLVGGVTKIVDGDTFDVLLEGDDETTRVRMQGIDAPESVQPMSDAAVALLGRLLGDGEVELQPAEQTSFGRIVARVYVDSVDVNAEMVRRGFAMAERRFLREFDDGASYCVFEQEARSNKRGIWRLPANQRIAPWEWRREREFTDYSNETVEGCVAAIGKPLGSTRPDTPVPLTEESPPGQWSCAVRKTCAQMQSCEEARFYLQQCQAPIDGNRDGVPCDALCR
jgi:endonuclease YncB( thermonuclease family)